jgi:hypothetical protein
MSSSAKTSENEEKFDLDDNLPIPDELSETELDTILNEMIVRVAKGLEKDQTEELRSLVFQFKDICRVALTMHQLLQFHAFPGQKVEEA